MNNQLPADGQRFDPGEIWIQYLTVSTSAKIQQSLDGTNWHDVADTASATPAMFKVTGGCFLRVVSGTALYSYARLDSF
ncbi:hypothetical protein [Roseiconus lacunae]|uniref:F5/8 type C domain-containing protein n=1 Tax=Roseiconus lacunae TaxID=2605694 RepID=A0ABT7PHN7_9BACT|nr:hypothetical protein [Roseiconus lacunae]MDM4015848.1 hypothetical protein [Roseiconus lacunae]